jgi:hypothetical protein
VSSPSSLDISDAADLAGRGVFWPSVFLSEDISNARIFTYGYNADVVAGLFQSSNSNNIFEHTTTMVARLKRELEGHDVGSRLCYASFKLFIFGVF